MSDNALLTIITVAAVVTAIAACSIAGGVSHVASMLQDWEWHKEQARQMALIAEEEFPEDYDDDEPTRQSSTRIG